MSIVVNGETLYSPKETAAKLGINVGMLRYHRNVGNIEGFEMGTTTYYSQAQIDAADLKPKKTGPKTGEKPEQAEGEEGRDTTVMFKRPREAACLVGAAS